MDTKQFRYAGEFEPQEAVLLCWCDTPYSMAGYSVHRVYAEVIEHLIGEVCVFVNCNGEAALAACKEALTAHGVPVEKIHFTQFEDELNWARDYGPDLLTDDCGHRRLINFSFNTYGMEDEQGETALAAQKIAALQAEVLGCSDVVHSTLITEGGNKEFNGDGILMTIEDTEVTKRNPHFTEQEIASEYMRLFGLKKVIWLPLPTFDDEEVFDGILDMVGGEPVFRSLSANGHIDEMCRFVGKNTILLAEVTEQEAQQLASAKITKERLDRAFEILSTQTDADGSPFTILRIPCPDPIYLTALPGDSIYEAWQIYKELENVGTHLRDGTPFPSGKIKLQPAMSYCNFLIANGVVLGQRYWKEGLPDSIREKDEAAKSILEAAFPDRRVVMIYATALNILGGGIHCITKNISRSDASIRR